MRTNTERDIPESRSGAGDVVDSETGECCIVGAGPAGVVLSLLLARRGVNVVLLEVHQDFDREFRGDTLHPRFSKSRMKLDWRNGCTNCRTSKSTVL